MNQLELEILVNFPVVCDVKSHIILHYEIVSYHSDSCYILFSVVQRVASYFLKIVCFLCIFRFFCDSLNYTLAKKISCSRSLQNGWHCCSMCTAFDLQYCSKAACVEPHKNIILRLHDEANMKQTWSKHIRNTRARRVLQVCFMFSSSCKQGITWTAWLLLCLTCCF